LAIDADSNPNLALTLGMPRDQLAGLPRIPREVLDRAADASGSRWVLTKPVDEIVRDHGVTAPDGVTLLLMGWVEHAGAG
jgi:CO dehydrogenase maturation factor